jgi:hypothetical protein
MTLNGDKVIRLGSAIDPRNRALRVRHKFLSQRLIEPPSLSRFQRPQGLFARAAMKGIYHILFLAASRAREAR